MSVGEAPRGKVSDFGLVAVTDDNFRNLVRHTLTGTQVKRHPRPTPVINLAAYGDKGFRPGVMPHFLGIARCGLATTHPGIEHWTNFRFSRLYGGIRVFFGVFFRA